MLVGCLCAALSAVGCAGGDEPEDAGGTPGDAGPRMDGAVRVDSGPVVPVDSGGVVPVDAGTVDRCTGIVCMGFEYCFDGACRPYPGCGAGGTCMAATDVCRDMFCVPRDRDVDGDGSPASVDCDETSTAIHPGAMERCNGRDDNCDMMVDEGDPGTLCIGDPSRGVCVMGHCGCPAGRFDLDREPANGCECTADPAPGIGETCGGARDLGMVDDTGQTLMVTGNVLPDDREVWFHFRAVDTPDTTCDNFHVDIRFATNPGTGFEMNVIRGACTDAASCAMMNVAQFSWATDFRMPGVMEAGECPCSAAGAPIVGQSPCSDNSADFYVRVTRRAGSMVDCSSFTLAITNGVYDT